MILTNGEIEEIRERCAKATPDPWEAYDPCYGTCPIGAMPCTPEGCAENHPVGVRAVEGPPPVDYSLEFEMEGDAAFVAHSREDIPKLLKYIDYLQDLLKKDSEDISSE